MPTALKEAVAHGSADITADITAFVTQHCNEATDRVSMYVHTCTVISTTTQLYIHVHYSVYTYLQFLYIQSILVCKCSYSTIITVRLSRIVVAR